jgi:hypothetical protein
VGSIPISGASLLCSSKHGVCASLLMRNELGSIPRSTANQLGAVVGYGVALQASCLEGFDSLGFHQFYLSKALSGCVHGLGPCGQGSNPCRETSFRILTANLKNSI